MKKEQERLAASDLFEGMISVRAVIESRLAFLRGDGGNDRNIEVLYCDSAGEGSRELAWLRHRSDDLGFSVSLLPREELEKMTVGSSHGGIAARCTGRHIPALTPDAVTGNGFYVMLEGIEDPYNFGYALRSLYAAGVTGVILPERNWMSAAGVVCRSSAGASERIPMYLSDGVTAAGILKSKGCRTVCADLRNAVSLYDADLSLPVFLVVGGEKRGISGALLEKADVRIRIDYGREFGESLSAASAATVAGFEIYRQNRRSV